MEVSSGDVRGQIPKGNRERQDTSELVTEETGRWGKKERKVKLKDGESEVVVMGERRMDISCRIFIF